MCVALLCVTVQSSLLGEFGQFNLIVNLCGRSLVSTFLSCMDARIDCLLNFFLVPFLIFFLGFYIIICLVCIFLNADYLGGNVNSKQC